MVFLIETSKVQILPPPLTTELFTQTKLHLESVNLLRNQPYKFWSSTIIIEIQIFYDSILLCVHFLLHQSHLTMHCFLLSLYYNQSKNNNKKKKKQTNLDGRRNKCSSLLPESSVCTSELSCTVELVGPFIWRWR